MIILASVLNEFLLIILFELKYGICPLGIVPLRNDYNHASEQVSQLLYGDCFKIIDHRKDWLKIRNQWDRYEGWICSNQCIKIPEEIYKSNSELEVKHSAHLLDYVNLPNSELFPIPLAGVLRFASTPLSGVWDHSLQTNILTEWFLRVLLDTTPASFPVTKIPRASAL